MSHHLPDDLDDRYKGSDPIIKARAESDSFNQLWLKPDRKMVPIQIIGFTLFGLLFTAFGLFAVKSAVADFRDNTFSRCFIGGVGAVLLYLGLRSLISVYRSL